MFTFDGIAFEIHLLRCFLYLPEVLLLVATDCIPRQRPYFLILVLGMRGTRGEMTQHLPS